jgi:NAD(P)-dependent dehydrogenase (short-subunit alcohol dehydrogenase family)
VSPGTPQLALVTGGGSGIGAEVCSSLRRHGLTVVVADVDLASARRVADEVGGRAEYLDVTDPASWRELRARLRIDGLIPDALVLNAGVAGGPELLELDLERYRTLFAVNVDGVVLGLSTFGPDLVCGGGGSVTVTASMAGLTGVAFDPVYAMTKHAVVGLVRSCADSLREVGVRLQAVCPGLAGTPLLGRAEAQLRAAEYPLLSAATVAETLTECVLGLRLDEVTVLQAGREPLPYRFAGVPGPRGGSTTLPSQISLGRIGSGRSDQEYA